MKICTYTHLLYILTLS